MKRGILIAILLLLITYFDYTLSQYLLQFSINDSSCITWFIRAVGIFTIFITMLWTIQSKKLFQITTSYFILSTTILILSKIIWGRYRPYEVFGGEQFTYWFIPQFLSTGSSFLSGHIYFACLTLPFLLLAIDNKKIILGIISIYIGLVGVQRILVGAHFPTDIIISIIINVFTFKVLQRKFTPHT